MTEVRKRVAEKASSCGSVKELLVSIKPFTSPDLHAALLEALASVEGDGAPVSLDGSSPEFKKFAEKVKVRGAGRGGAQAWGARGGRRMHAGRPACPGCKHARSHAPAESGGRPQAALEDAAGGQAHGQPGGWRSTQLGASASSAASSTLQLRGGQCWMRVLARCHGPQVTKEFAAWVQSARVADTAAEVSALQAEASTLLDK